MLLAVTTHDGNLVVDGDVRAPEPPPKAAAASPPPKMQMHISGTTPARPAPPPADEAALRERYDRMGQALVAFFCLCLAIAGIVLGIKLTP
jgi:hypothetical protein